MQEASPDTPQRSEEMSDAIRQAAVAAAKKIGERLHAGQPIWSEDVADIIERAMRKLCVQPAPIA